MRYDIIATLGPSSADKHCWNSMLNAGASAFRLNTSHLSMAQLENWLDKLYSSIIPPIPLILDLQGSKWRLGTFKSIKLESGQRIKLICANSSSRQQTLPVPHPDFFQAAWSSNGEILLNDGKIQLQGESYDQESIIARVQRGGLFSSNKGITLSSSEYRKEKLLDKDKTIITKTRQLKNIRYAISYVKDAKEMAGYRETLGNDHYIIAKLERRSAIKDSIGIANHANELWICRGDLGSELGLADMAKSVYLFSKEIKKYSVPVYLAGQVLEHMTEHPIASRSEVSYIYESLIKGYAGFILSDETATGQHPVSSCQTAALFLS